MAYGEAEHGCAQGDAGLAGHNDPPTSGKHHSHRRSKLVDSVSRPAEEPPTVPRQRVADCIDPEPVRQPSCRSDLPGWAGAHRHGPVRPSQRAVRRERPPRRWC